MIFGAVHANAHDYNIILRKIRLLESLDGLIECETSFDIKKYSLAFKEPGGSLLSLHKPTIGAYLKQYLSSLQHHNPPPSNPF